MNNASQVPVRVREGEWGSTRMWWIFMLGREKIDVGHHRDWRPHRVEEISTVLKPLFHPSQTPAQPFITIASAPCPRWFIYAVIYAFLSRICLKAANWERRRMHPSLASKAFTCLCCSVFVWKNRVGWGTKVACSWEYSFKLWWYSSVKLVFNNLGRWKRDEIRCFVLLPFSVITPGKAVIIHWRFQRKLLRCSYKHHRSSVRKNQKPPPGQNLTSIIIPNTFSLIDWWWWYGKGGKKSEVGQGTTTNTSSMSFYPKLKKWPTFHVWPPGISSQPGEFLRLARG